MRFTILFGSIRSSRSLNARLCVTSTSDTFKLLILIIPAQIFNLFSLYLYSLPCSSLIKIFLRHDAYPNGVTKLILDTTPSTMALMVVSPGKYYDRDRYFNQLYIENMEDYGFTVRWVDLKKNQSRQRT